MSRCLVHKLDIFVRSMIIVLSAGEELLGGQHILKPPTALESFNAVQSLHRVLRSQRKLSSTFRDPFYFVRNPVVRLLMDPDFFS